MDEQALIIASQAGDRQAFGELYDRHIRHIYGFIFLKTRHKETAEDLTSETFLKALAHIGSVDPARPIAPWLYTIAKNVVRDHYRAKASIPQANIEDIWDLAGPEDTAGEAEQTLRARHLADYLHKLGSRERDILMMRVWQELSYEEIAVIIGASPAAAKVSYSRTLKKLRNMLPKGLAAAIALINLIRFNI
jgi:RNA polymerase sigma-70 factor (ECF subfamily)